MHFEKCFIYTQKNNISFHNSFIAVGSPRRYTHWLIVVFVFPTCGVCLAHVYRLRIAICFGIVSHTTHIPIYRMNTNSNSPKSSPNSPSAGGLPQLPSSPSVWGGPFYLEGEVKKEEEKDEDDDDDDEPRTPRKSGGSPSGEWSPLPSPLPSPSPYRHSSPQNQPSPDRRRPNSPLRPIPVGEGLKENTRGTLRFHNRVMDHLVDALNQSCLAHDEMCREVSASLIGMEERTFRNLNPDALHYMTSALRGQSQRRPQQKRQHVPVGKRRSSKSPTKSERKARAKAARRRSSNSGCGPDCGHMKSPKKRDDQDDPPSYAPSIPIK